MSKKKGGEKKTVGDDKAPVEKKGTGKKIPAKYDDADTIRGVDGKPIETFKHLDVQLTADELARRGERQAKLITDLELEKEAHKERAAESRGLCKTLQKEILSLSRQITYGKEERQVRTIQRRNLKQNSIDTIRLDTETVADNRPMTYEDRQEILAFKDKDKKPADAKPTEAKASDAKPTESATAETGKKKKGGKKEPPPSLHVVKDKPEATTGG